ncbi:MULTISPECIES: desulfoferrodoxin family protein [unclassified Methanosarcina]|uniref:desulfoferrodoxin family protein n=1 Tax=unclassified Methanosarcina TaxID=2644672 RepID=UPI000615552A|nr:MULTISPECIES: desulfoferrodoxin family protein [unclassified Methanosarcina]AKB17804.1 Superoxide reductase [Methanosarcina sp. WWM596]AKB21153.1 Superoxide reductase [Methanosarcina sp. WH1]
MVEGKINKPADPKNLTEGDKKHIPAIYVPKTIVAGKPFDVIVEVGLIPHVMEEKHHIEWIELYLNDNKIGKVELSLRKNKKAEATFTIEADKSLAGKESKLHALEHCNIHGTWEEFMTIKMS